MFMANYIPKNLLPFVKGILILIIGLLLLYVLVKIVRKILKKSRLDSMLYKFVINSIKIIYLIILIFMFCDKMGLKTTSIVAMLSVVGATIALALKDSLGNIAGGIVILVTKPFSNGDLIDIDKYTGRVKHVDLILTTIVTLDNKVVMIPNGLVTNSVIVNNSREDVRRVDSVFAVGNGGEATKAKKIIENVVSSTSKILKIPEPFISIAQNTVHVNVWVRTENYWDVKYFLEENIVTSFDKNGINSKQIDVKIAK